jgi:hypothetical protein
VNGEPAAAAGEPGSGPAAPASDPGPTPEPAPANELALESAAAAVQPLRVPPVESSRRLLGASFDLLTRTSDDMRRASFYIGFIALGTVGPLAIASLMLEAVAIHHTRDEMQQLLDGGLGAVFGLLGIVAGLGLLVAAVESEAMAASILGGQLSGRPVSTPAALERSRMVFWRVIVGSVIVAIPIGIAQLVVDALFAAALGPQADVSFVTSVIVAILVGAPLAYVLAGVVLGDVSPVEATVRSVRVFRARKVAAALVAVFATIAYLLVLLGLSAGLDVALRVFDALGLGPESGPAGLILVVVGIAIGVFALGTLVYTALAISLAPQIVMFVGLTRATFGLDHVRPGGDRDPMSPRPGRPQFRWLTRPMLGGVIIGLVCLVAFLRVSTS